jgi:hypothetical protein
MDGHTSGEDLEGARGAPTASQVTARRQSVYGTSELDCN